MIHGKRTIRKIEMTEPYYQAPCSYARVSSCGGNARWERTIHRIRHRTKTKYQTSTFLCVDCATRWIEKEKQMFTNLTVRNGEEQVYGCQSAADYFRYINANCTRR